MPGRNRLQRVNRKIRPIFRAANLKNTFDCNKIWSKDFGVPSFGHSSSDSFCESMKFPILIGQFVCLIPLSSNEKLGWRSFRLCASLILIVGQIAMAILSLVWLHRGEVSIFKSGTVLFFGGAAVMEILMIRLSLMWSPLLDRWRDIEYHFGYHKNLKKIFALISTLIIVFSTVEHLSNFLYGLFATSSSSKILQNYTSTMFPQVFRHVSYTMWRALPILYINSVSTLIYSFSDQLIIMISLTLGNYFILFNRKISILRGKMLRSAEWKLLRLKYTKLCELTYSIDDCLCHLLCLTFVIHLYIACVEMHQGILYNADDNEKVHKICTFVVSILRACALCYTTIRVHENSKNILDILYATPAVSYSEEIELFIQQVLQSEIVLSGSHMFSMKRPFLLTIVGTVVSYQILLLQMKEFARPDIREM